MEYDSVVVPSFRKFCEVFACLIIFSRYIWLECWIRKKTYARCVVPIQLQLYITQICLKYDWVHVRVSCATWTWMCITLNVGITWDRSISVLTSQVTSNLPLFFTSFRWRIQWNTRKTTPALVQYQEFMDKLGGADNSYISASNSYLPWLGLRFCYLMYYTR